MSDLLTLDALLAAHFKGKLCAPRLGKLPVTITNTPDFSKASYTVKADGVPPAGGYTLLPGTRMALTDISLVLVFNGASKASTGTLKAKIVDLHITIDVTVILSSDGDEEVKGSFKATTAPFDIKDALALMGISPDLPAHFGDPKAIDLKRFDMSVDFQREEVILAGQSSANTGATVYAHRVDNAWRLALLVQMSKRWKVGDLSPALAPFDTFFRFDGAFVGLASHDSVLMDRAIMAELGDHSFTMHAGLNVGVALDIDAKQKTLAKLVHGVTGDIKGLFLAGAINLHELHLSVALDDLALSFPLKTGVPLRISGTDMSLDCTLPEKGEPQLAVLGNLAFPTGKPKETFEVYGNLTIAPSELRFIGDAAGFKIDFGNGIVLDELGGTIGVKADAPGVELGLNGRMELDDSTSDVAVTMLVPQLTPLLIHGAFTNVSFAPVFLRLCYAARLPGALKKGIFFKDLTLTDCNDFEVGCILDGVSIPAKLNIKGEAVIFGFDATAGLEVTESGMGGEFSVAQPLTAPGFVVHANGDPHKGPSFVLNTRAIAPEPLFKIDYDMTVFGVHQFTKVDLNTNGLTAHTGITFQNKQLHLACTLARKGARFVGTIKGDVSFGKAGLVIKVDKDTSITLNKVTVSLSTAGVFKCSVTGSAKHGLFGHKTGTICVNVKASSLGGDLRKLSKKIQHGASDFNKWRDL